MRRAGDAVDAVSSTGKPKLPQWPWLATAVAAATDHDVVLDGEVIAYDDDGRHTFQSVGRAGPRPRLRRVRPAGPRRRRTFATGRGASGGSCWRRPCDPASPLTITPVSDDAEVMEAATRAQRFEGIVAKRASSTYQSGRRVPAWVKVKYRNAQEMVVGGYKLGEGNRTGSFGSLLVGVHDDDGELQFVSAVGTGFNERTLTEMMTELRQLETDTSPVRRAAEAAPWRVPLGAPASSSPRSGSSSGPRAAASAPRCSSACATTSPPPTSSARPDPAPPECSVHRRFPVDTSRR